MRIHVLGASGSGTTTLGRALAARFSLPFVDSDDIVWEKTDPPYQTWNPRREEELAAALPGGGWVLSGSVVGWGEFLRPNFTHVIFLALDTATRLARLRAREVSRHGPRVAPGGDMHGTHLDFLAWAAEYDNAALSQRSLALHEEWLRDLPCQVLRLSGAWSTAEQIRVFEEALRPLRFTVDQLAEAASLVDPLYASHGKAARARPDDVYFVARAEGEVVGCVRYCVEHGTRMLRSMLVAERARGKGVGAALLEAFAANVPRAPAHCVALTHLESFYARIGFRRVESGPAFLLERMQRYREQGQSAILMLRDS